MSENIVQLISSHLGGNVNRLSSLLGETPEKTQGAVGAAVPTLLAGLTHVASTPEGANRLQNTINQQDPNVVSNFTSRLTEGGAVNPEASSNMLTNLLGGGLSSNLTSVLGRFTGMKGGSMTGLLGSIAPLALGLIGKQANVGRGGDASGITNYLNSQKQNVTAAMPSGLSSLLGSIPGLGGFVQKAEPELAHAGAAPSYTGTTGPRVYSEARPVGHARHASPWRWLLPLIALGLIIWGLSAWNRNRRAQAPVPATTTEQPRTVSQPGAGTTAPGGAAALTSNLRDTLGNASSTLSGITDANSAQQAVPQLNQLSDKLSGMKSQMDALPAAAKPTVMNSVQPSVARIQEQSAKIRGMPGVSPTVQSSLDKLDASVGELKQSQ